MLEHGNRFDVRGLRKHVHNPGPDQPIPLASHQDSSISRQTPRMAGNIHDPSRPPLCHTFHDFNGARTRRIEKHEVEGLPGPRS